MVSIGLARLVEVSQHLGDVFFTDENIGIAIGAWGTIRKTTDGGQNWIAQYNAEQHPIW